VAAGLGARNASQSYYFPLLDQKVDFCLIVNPSPGLPTAAVPSGMQLSGHWIIGISFRVILWLRH